MYRYTVGPDVSRASTLHLGLFIGPKPSSALFSRAQTISFLESATTICACVRRQLNSLGSVEARARIRMWVCRWVSVCVCVRVVCVCDVLWTFWTYGMFARCQLLRAMGESSQWIIQLFDLFEFKVKLYKLSSRVQRCQQYYTPFVCLTLILLPFKICYVMSYSDTDLIPS